MAKEKVDPIDEKVSKDEVITELNDIQEALDKIINSAEYAKIMKYSQKLQTAINEDNAKIEKEGMSKFTYEQKQALVSLGCAIATMDFSTVTVGNLVGLRHHIEYQTLKCILLNEAEKKK